MKLKPVTPVPQMGKPIVDHLAYVLPLGVDMKEGAHEKMMRRIKRAVKAALEEGECIPWYPRGNRYKMAIEFKPTLDTSIKIGIGAIQKDRQNGDIRISLNPDRLNVEAVKTFHAFMEKIIGKPYKELLRNPLINRIDVAVDVLGLVLDQILVKYSHAQRHTVIIKRVNRDGRIEGLNCGSVSSDYFMAVYDKRSEQLDKALKRIARRGVRSESSKSVAINQLMSERQAIPMTRIEVRGRKVRGKALHEVVGFTNRLERLNFACLNDPIGSISDHTRTVFLSLCRDRGVKAALRLYEGKPVHAQLKALWTEKPDWWKPKGLWADAVLSLKALKLFHKSAFEAD